MEEMKKGLDSDECGCNKCHSLYEISTINEINDEESGERRTLKINVARIIISIGLVIIGIILGEEKSIYVLFMIAAYLSIGYIVLFEAAKGLLNRKFLDENFLMTIASLGAMAMGEYIEGIAVLLLYTVGNMFEEMAVGKSKRSIKALLSIKPDYANIEGDDGSIKMVDPASIPVGTVILVKPGEKIPIDGVVVNGHSTLDTKTVTGESLPAEVSEGSSVYSGSININSVISVKTTLLFKESTVAKILELTQNARERKSKSEQFITKFSKYYTPLVVMAAVLIAFLPPIILGFTEYYQEYIKRALAFLVVSCPCALVISVPLTYFGAIGYYSRKGILVKGSNYIELLNSIKTVVFDKTGTLTTGEFKVLSLKNNSSNDVSKDQLLSVLLTAEKMSEHPIAQAIWAEYENTEIGMMVQGIKIEEFTDYPGEGVEAATNERVIFAGNEKLMARVGISAGQLIQDERGTNVYVCVKNRNKEELEYFGSVTLGDVVKPGAKSTVSYLNEKGFKTVMLTGDSEKPAAFTAEETGVSDYAYSMFPADKVAYVEELKLNSKTMFIGDGINDAPSVMTADIGVAMGDRGSEYAAQISDIVIVDDDISKLPYMFEGAARTKRIVTENIVFALGVKALVLILSAVGIANMWLAIFADVGVSILAILNALRMLSTKK